MLSLWKKGQQIFPEEKLMKNFAYFSAGKIAEANSEKFLSLKTKIQRYICVS